MKFAHFVYRIMAMRPHGKKATWQEIVSQEGYIYMAFCTAIALQSIRLFQSHCVVFRPPTPACIYIRFYSRSISNRYGSLLSAVAMGLNIPLQGSLFGLPHGDETGQPLLLPPCALHTIRMVRMWRMKH